MADNISIQQLRIPTGLYIEVAKRLNDGETMRNGILRMLRENVTGERHIVVFYDDPAPVVERKPRKPVEWKPADTQLMDEAVRPLLVGKTTVTVDEIGGMVSNLVAGPLDQSVTARIARSLRRAGWCKYRMPVDARGRRAWAYKPLWRGEEQAGSGVAL